MVYGRYNQLVNGVYKPTYNWGAPSCMVSESPRRNQAAKEKRQGHVAQLKGGRRAAEGLRGGARIGPGLHSGKHWDLNPNLVMKMYYILI